MDGQGMSVKEVLQMVADDIARIQVPVEYADQISRPLCQALVNIRNCIAAIQDKEEPAQEGDENV